MILTENGIRYKIKKRALLLSALGTVGGTVAIAKLLGITLEDLKNMKRDSLLKLIPASILSSIVSNFLIAKSIRFANPISRRVRMVNGVWRRRRGSRRSRRGSRRSRRSRRGSRRSRR